ncbi:MAG: Lysine--tRNA ligase [Saprospiraceae bacterium]|jgi:lysyl-tRNA synthetase class 2|nr:Lysine--tRNA ligase [Saprospiraceae bacterium]
MQQLSEQQIVRRNALNEILAMGINPYPAEAFEVTTDSAAIRACFDSEPDRFTNVSIAGRLMMIRDMGKACFAELQDERGRIQLYIKRDEICPGEDKGLYDQLFKRLSDIGDFFGARGYVFRTKVGELSIHVVELRMLSKSLHPLPVVKTDADGKVHDAFTDPEQRYRHRYVDLIVNPQVREIFVRRSHMIQEMRNFFNSRGWLEVETPVLQNIHGGAAARPFHTHHNALDIPLFLRIANELYLKRLIVGGYSGVYEIGKMFRNEGMDRTHNPEFTSMEIYVAYKDYLWMMDMVEEMLEFVVEKVCGRRQIEISGHTIRFEKPFRRISMLDAIREFGSLEVEGKSEAELRTMCRNANIQVDASMGWGKLIDELFSELVEPHLIQPTYIMDYPLEMTPLAKKHRSKDGLVERFELYVNGKEIANAYTELNDPLDQRQRFEEQLKLAARGDEEAMAMDEDFLLALEYGMPPTSGLGIGIDRLAMLLTGQEAIQEVLLFPQMKPVAG